MTLLLLGAILDEYEDSMCLTHLCQSHQVRLAHTADDDPTLRATGLTREDNGVASAETEGFPYDFIGTLENDLRHGSANRYETSPPGGGRQKQRKNPQQQNQT